MSDERKLFSSGDEFEFKRAFVISFLAWNAAHIFEQIEASKRRPPVEDAEHLANVAWVQLVEQIGVNET